MATRFVIGRAGSGKTHFLLDRLAEHLAEDPLTQSVVYLVPKQATFLTQRTIATDPRLGGYVNVRVIAPDDLGELALVESGQPASARLDSTGRAMILGHLLRTHAKQLQHFGRSATQPGLAAEIDRAFTEFERAGRDLCEIDELIDSAGSSEESSQQALARKLGDLCVIYRLYQQYLKDHGLDPFSRQMLVTQAIEQNPLFTGALVLIDDFYDFTAYERLMIASLASVAKATWISVLLDPESPIVTDPHWIPPELDLFYRTETAYRKLYFDLSKAAVVIDSPVLLSRHPRYDNSALAAIETGFGQRHPTSEEAGGSVRQIVVADATEEVAAAAREIKSLIGAGLRLRDICVLARWVDEYEPLIDASFSEYAIAYFVDRRRPATHHPLIRTLLALLTLTQARWNADAINELLSAGLTDADPAAVDLLDDYVRQHNLLPDAWQTDEPWQFHRPPTEDEPPLSHFNDAEVQQVNALRVKLRKALADILDPKWSAEPKPMRKRMEDMLAVLAAMGIRERMIHLITTAEQEKRVQDQEEHLLVWSRFVELSDQCVNLLGEVSSTGSEFCSLLQSSLNEMELAITPPTLDQVLVGSVDRTRVGNPKAVILLGMTASQFPKSVLEKPLLNDRDRHSLRESGVEVDPPTRRLLLDERFLGYLAVTRARSHLIMIRRAADTAGNELATSPFWDVVNRCVVGVSEERITAKIGRIATPSQLIVELLRWARDSDDHDSVDHRALYNWLAKSPTPAVKDQRDRAWRVLKYRNAPAITKSAGDSLFSPRLEASVSRLESYAACPFQHFARYELRLQEPPEPGVTALDLGNLYHSVLEHLVRKTVEDKLDFTKTNGISPERIRDVAQEIGANLRNQIFLTSARNRFTLEQLERFVARLLGSQQHASGLGQFRPAFLELQFGRDAALPPLELETPAGNKVLLRGKIDRIDVDPSGSRYVVTDYKLNGESLHFGNVAHGLMLQLLTYLLVLEAHGKTLTGKELTPAAAFYVRLLRSIDSVKNPQESPTPGTPEFHTKAKIRGVIDESFADDLDRTFIETNKSVAYAMTRKQDEELAATNNDVLPTTEFAALVNFVRLKILELSDAILAQDISIAPYLIGKKSACARCSFQRVCRFDRLINSYRRLPSLKRSDAISLIVREGGES